MKQIARFLIQLLAGLGMAFGVACYEHSRGSFTVFRLASDGCFVAAVLFFAVGGLRFIARQNEFTSLSFACKKLAERILHPREDSYSAETYANYVRNRSQETAHSGKTTILVAAVLVAVAIGTALLA